MTVRTEKGFFKILNEILKVMIITPWALELAEFREKAKYLINTLHMMPCKMSCKTCKIVKQLDTQKCPSVWVIGILGYLKWFPNGCKNKQLKVFVLLIWPLMRDINKTLHIV